MRVASAAGRPSPVPTESERRLIHSAHEFEGQMLKEMLKALTSNGDMSGDEGAGTGLLGEFGAESLAQTLSERGGFGIADRILMEVGRPPGK